MQASVPLVSALVTTFNHEGFIDSAITSLLAQTYPAMEIIVVDDGSQDRTVERACDYRSRGVRVLQGPRQGPSQAMNMAMAEATGDIFLLQSGDDLSSPVRAEAQVRALAKADLHATFPTLIDGEGGVLADSAFPVFFRAHSVTDMGMLFKSLYEDGNFLCASSVGLRRSAWERLGGFHPGLLQLQDYDYWLRALTSGLVLAIDPDRLVSYRLHDKNLSRSANNVRMHREMGAIFRAFGTRVPDSFINVILYDGSFDGVGWQDDNRDVLLALLYLRHPIESVRQIGIEALISLLGHAPSAAMLEHRFGLSFRALFDLFLRG
ncbi:glycosyltransferase family 2 protein [Sphingomonas sp. PAMC 26621]|uniref:glycosyltransferase family 2 protein n=1 Tax=Sphingomonas sp. PAMC 26621 TaxID=1112213 RepID=UPI001EE63EF0|nr:glycosyltransferase [Sphingomonas sp. PAMC 26621]